MKKNIHPKYNNVIIKCSCGKVFNIKSTLKKNFFIEICSHCHPVYTGKQKKINIGNRIDRFNKQFGTT
ncbi:50S ribosomal protein L31 [Candidatus Portiera aleyrodidarum]|uniref:50S ribosomal protein L31 n=1 Tax=Candidatus Portiera aleyrodidarum TV TaxID=1297582 RepID=A0A8D4BPN2_9GAMM|nr:50S ribosomal protein L31 [Candidatus Portiera aleyrodidarum]AGI27030.1 ribosomal protein L31 [Candidatus Portiera aleyrodidarum TV]CEI58986.1 50S ribosomal protein L31 [Candidatus Portiera aleyrodidarum]